MTTYTLKWISTYYYNLYDGTTLVTDADLAALFGSAGEAYFVFDFDGNTPTQTDRVYVRDTANTANIIYKTGVATIIKEGYRFKGTWTAGAATFTTFAQLPGRTLDEVQLSDLMGKIKDAGKAESGAGAPTTATAAKYVGQLYYDTTNDNMYYCSAIIAQGTNPETYSYTWETLGGGGGVITVKYSDYNPTLVTTPQPLGKFLYESGVKTGDTVVIENDTNEPFMYIVATEGVRYQIDYIKTVPCYIVNNNESSGSATFFQFYIIISGISYKWNYYISGSNYEFESETVISSNNVKPYGSDYYGPYDVLSAGSGNALSTLVQVATNIAGLSPVEGTFSGLVGITCDQQKTPGDPEWYGEMEVSSTTPYNFETASVGTIIYVYVRSDAGLPLYYSPTDWAEPFQITDTSGNTIEVSEYIFGQFTGQPTPNFVNFVPGKYIGLKKFSNDWCFVNSIADAQYLPRTIATS